MGGASAKKKKEKKQDFQRTKLKVGKAKAKPANFTDTSFKSKAIVLNQQSLRTDAPETAELFRHNLSLAATSRSDNQRRDALAFLTGQLSANPPTNPVGTPGLLNRLLPLISDMSTPVRAQLLKLLRALPAPEVRPCADRVVMYVRAGITHLSTDIRNDALSVLEWLLDVAGKETVSCPGGWMKTLNTFAAMMGWGSMLNAVASSSSSSSPSSSATPSAVTGGKGWTSAPKSTFGAEKGGQSYARQLAVLARFLEVGFAPEPREPWTPRAYWDSLYRAPMGPGGSPFAYLNLFGQPRDVEGEMYDDRADRQEAFMRSWHGVVVRAIDHAKKEGGAVGRAASALDQALRDGLAR